MNTVFVALTADHLPSRPPAPDPGVASCSRSHTLSDHFSSSFDSLETELSFADVDPGEGQRWSTWPAITRPSAALSRGRRGW